MISGMHLQQFHSLRKLLYSYMFSWMPWILTNGKPAMQGNLYSSIGLLRVYTSLQASKLLKNDVALSRCHNSQLELKCEVTETI